MAGTAAIRHVLRRQVARLQRSCHRLIWLNPLIGTVDYAPLTRGLQAALPFVDDFLAARTLADLAELAVHLSAVASSAPSRRRRAHTSRWISAVHIRLVLPRRACGISSWIPSAIASCIPGCESLEPEGPDRYHARLTVALAAITGTYEGTVIISDKVEHSSYRLTRRRAGEAGIRQGQCGHRASRRRQRHRRRRERHGANGRSNRAHGATADFRCFEDDAGPFLRVPAGKTGLVERRLVSLRVKGTHDPDAIPSRLPSRIRLARSRPRAQG